MLFLWRESKVLPENLEKIVHLLRQAQEGFQGFKVIN